MSEHLLFRHNEVIVAKDPIQITHIESHGWAGVNELCDDLNILRVIYFQHIRVLIPRRQVHDRQVILNVFVRTARSSVSLQINAYSMKHVYIPLIQDSTP